MKFVPTPNYSMIDCINDLLGRVTKLEIEVKSISETPKDLEDDLVFVYCENSTIDCINDLLGRVTKLEIEVKSISETPKDLEDDLVFVYCENESGNHPEGRRMLLQESLIEQIPSKIVEVSEHDKIEKDDGSGILTAGVNYKYAGIEFCPYCEPEKILRLNPVPKGQD